MKYTITNTNKDSDGDITEVKTSGGSEFSVEKVIEMIESKIHFFIVKEGSSEVSVHVIQGIYKKYIRTVKDGIETNNLDELDGFTRST